MAPAPDTRGAPTPREISVPTPRQPEGPRTAGQPSTSRAGMLVLPVQHMKVSFPQKDKAPLDKLGPYRPIFCPYPLKNWTGEKTGIFDR
jgi:hypothetical protein